LIVAGKVKWVRERGMLKFDKKRLLFEGFGTTQDITARKRYELQLAESRQLYSAIFASAMDAIITLDADQYILLFNPAAEKMFGCTADEASGEFIQRLIPEWFGAAGSACIGTVANAEIANFFQKKDELRAVTGLRANGEEFPIEAAISQCEVDGKTLYTAVLRDVTDRVRVESALQERLRWQDQLTKIAASVPGVICSFRLHPDGTACMPYASPAIESLYGFSHNVLVEDFSPVYDRIHRDDISHINETLAESARSLQPCRDAYRYNHPVKGEVWLEGHSVPQREEENSILWHGYIHDVTEHKRVERELQERIERRQKIALPAAKRPMSWSSDFATRITRTDGFILAAACYAITITILTVCSEYS
jgi:PAS domain S-box-containing protein